jgi:hypothetical protein
VRQRKRLRRGPQLCGYPSDGAVAHSRAATQAMAPCGDGARATAVSALWHPERNAALKRRMYRQAAHTRALKDLERAIRCPTLHGVRTAT